MTQMKADPPTHPDAGFRVQGPSTRSRHNHESTKGDLWASCAGSKDLRSSAFICDICGLFSWVGGGFVPSCLCG